MLTPTVRAPERQHTTMHAGGGLEHYAAGRVAVVVELTGGADTEVTSTTRDASPCPENSMNASPVSDAAALTEAAGGPARPRSRRGVWLTGPALGAVSLVVTVVVHQAQRTTLDPWGYSLPVFALVGAVVFLLIDTVTSFVLHRNRVRAGRPLTVKAFAVLVLASLAWPPALFFAVAAREDNPPLWTITGTPHTRAVEQAAVAIDALPAPGQSKASAMKDTTSYPATSPEDEVEIAFSKVFFAHTPAGEAAAPADTPLTYEDLVAWMNAPAWKEGDLAAALGGQGKVVCYPHGEGHAKRPDLIDQGSPECEMEFYPPGIPDAPRRDFTVDDREFFVNATLLLNPGMRSSLVVRIAYEANP